MPNEPSFADLMARLRQGDQEAAAVVFRRFARRLIGLARTHLDGRLRRKVDPEDVLQSAFRSFFVRQADGQFDLAGWDSLWSLLALITLRKCGRQAELFRTGFRDVGRELDLAGEADDSHWQALSADPNPAEAAILAETVEQLMKALPGVRERQMLELSLQGYSLQEISGQVSRSERTVHRVLTLVRARLELMRDEDLDPEAGRERSLFP